MPQGFFSQEVFAAFFKTIISLIVAAEREKKKKQQKKRSQWGEADGLEGKRRLSGVITGRPEGGGESGDAAAAAVSCECSRSPHL